MTWICHFSLTLDSEDAADLVECVIRTPAYTDRRKVIVLDMVTRTPRNLNGNCQIHQGSLPADSVGTIGPTHSLFSRHRDQFLGMADDDGNDSDCTEMEMD